MEVTEKPIEWEVGQVVWDTKYGKGVVVEADSLNFPKFPVSVNFERVGQRNYSADGKNGGAENNRSLYFSEPVITAERFPPKKPFTPILKEGDQVVVKTDWGEDGLYTVKEETECHIYFEERLVILHKSNIKAIYKLGEEVKI